MNNQQRRSFFVTTAKGTDVTSHSRASTIHTRTACWLSGQLAAILTALFLLSSCATFTPDRIAVLAQIASQAAQAGAHNWLAAHPDQKPLFDLVIAELMALISAGITNQQAYLERLKQLPTTTLVGPEGAVVVTSTNLVVRDDVARRATVLVEPATMPVLRATVGGLRKGCGPQPPVPMIVEHPVRRVVPRGTVAPTQRVAPALSDEELNRQFEEYQRRKKAR